VSRESTVSRIRGGERRGGGGRRGGARDGEEGGGGARVVQVVARGGVLTPTVAVASKVELGFKVFG
jgi:hypothetical protein